MNTDIQEMYEKAFGKDTATRNKKQWRNLVRVYGIDTVMEKEGLTEQEVKEHCETFSERLKRQMKNA